MTNEEQKLREIVDKTFPLFGSRLDEWRKVERDRLLSDLTALISEYYYPKEFVKWLIHNTCEATTYSPMLYKKLSREKRQFNIITNGNSQMFDLSKEWHIDELFNYWKENER